MNNQIKKTQSISHLVSVLTLILGSISACTPSPDHTMTPTISSDKAIEIAMDGCKTPHLVLTGKPKNIQAKLLTLEEADKLIRIEGEVTNYGISMDTTVWLVQMDGQLQLVGGPPPVTTEDSHIVTVTPTSSLPFWGTCTVILDATSGVILIIHG
jgi:hypothetical protein